jgi:hypothetical protein
MISKTRLVAFLALGAIGIAGAQTSGAPPMPFVDEGACPFEGCLYRDWRAKKSVAVYESWDRRAPVRRVFSVEAGETVTAMTGVVITTVPGRAVIRRSMTGQAHSRFFPYERPVSIPLKPGDVVYLLTNQGEGFQTAWFNQMLFTLDRSGFSNAVPDARCKQTDTCTGEIIEYPLSVWWAKIRNAQGQIGWTNQTADFDGPSALGN